MMLGLTALTFVLITDLKYNLFYVETDMSKGASSKILCGLACSDYELCGGFAYDDNQVTM